MDKKIKITNFLNELKASYPQLAVCNSSINEAFDILKEVFSSNGKLLLAGNGGSCSDADHIVGELMKGFHKPRPFPREFIEKANTEEEKEMLLSLQQGLPAINLMNNPTLISAFCNDVNPHYMFAQQVLSYGNKNDCLLVMSTSGNSKNIVHAVQCAKLKNMKTIALTGEKESKLSKICDITIKAPASITPQIQEYHLPIYHVLCSMLEEYFF